MKILITGCAGFIGYHLSKYLINKNINVIGVDNINNYYQLLYKIEENSTNNTIKINKIRNSLYLDVLEDTTESTIYEVKNLFNKYNYNIENDNEFQIDDVVMILSKNKNGKIIKYNKIKSLFNNYIDFYNPVEEFYFILKKISIKYVDMTNNKVLLNQTQIDKYLSFNNRYTIDSNNLILKENIESEFSSDPSESDNLFSYYEMRLDVYLKDLLQNADYKINGFKAVIKYKQEIKNNIYLYYLKINSDFIKSSTNYLVIKNMLYSNSESNEIINYVFLFPFNMIFKNTSSLKNSSFFVNEKHIEKINSEFNFQKVNTSVQIDTDIIQKINEIIVFMNQSKINPITQKMNTTNQVAWVKKIGYYLFENVSFYMGTELIDKYDSDWMNLYENLLSDRYSQYDKMIGNIPNLYEFSKEKKAMILYIPLRFWFCTKPGLALPLISLSNTELRIHLKIRNFEDCVKFENIDQGYDRGKIEMKLLGTYYYLDSNERKLFAESKHEYLIETTQYKPAEFLNNSIEEIQFYFQNPIKDLIWFFRPIENIDNKNYTDYVYINKEKIYDKFELEFLEYKNKYTEYRSNNNNNNELIYDNLSKIFKIFEDNQHLDYEMLYKQYLRSTKFKSNTSEQRKNYSINRYFQNRNIEVIKYKDILKEAKLKIYGVDKTALFDYRYFHLLENLKYKQSSLPGTYMYSFALYPTEYQPSGSCNMSVVKDTSLYVKLNPEVTNYPVQFNLYGRGLNILRVMSGMGGLAFYNSYG